jgi:hypothetical protein
MYEPACWRPGVIGIALSPLLPAHCCPAAQQMQLDHARSGKGLLVGLWFGGGCRRA